MKNHLTLVAAAAVAVLALAACEKKDPAPTCGTADTPACATAGPAHTDGAPEQQK